MQSTRGQSLYWSHLSHFVIPRTRNCIGLQSAPQMAQQHGGLYQNQQYQTFVDNVGNKLINNSIAKQTPYKYDFHLLADEKTINAFALPRG